MYRKILVAGVTAATIVGAGGVALATTGSGTTSGQPTSTSSTPSGQSDSNGTKGGKDGKGGGKLLRHLAHGQFVTKGKNGVVTHDLIRGSVTSVSPTAITVVAVDKKSETFTIGNDTKVLSKAKGQKAAASTISKVAKGDHVLVAGTGATTYTALHVVDLGTQH